MKRQQELTKEAIAILKKLIETQSFSSEEDQTAVLIETWFIASDIEYTRTKNNVWAINKHFDKSKYAIVKLASRYCKTK